MTYSCASCFTEIQIFVSHSEGRTQADVVRDQGNEKDILV
jgi:hypothetical protein